MTKNKLNQEILTQDKWNLHEKTLELNVTNELLTLGSMFFRGMAMDQLHVIVSNFQDMNFVGQNFVMDAVNNLIENNNIIKNELILDVVFTNALGLRNNNSDKITASIIYKVLLELLLNPTPLCAIGFHTNTEYDVGGFDVAIRDPNTEQIAYYQFKKGDKSKENISFKIDSEQLLRLRSLQCDIHSKEGNESNKSVLYALPLIPDWETFNTNVGKLCRMCIFISVSDLINRAEKMKVFLHGYGKLHSIIVDKNNIWNISINSTPFDLSEGQNYNITHEVISDFVVALIANECEIFIKHMDTKDKIPNSNIGIKILIRILFLFYKNYLYDYFEIFSKNDNKKYSLRNNDSYIFDAINEKLKKILMGDDFYEKIKNYNFKNYTYLHKIKAKTP